MRSHILLIRNATLPPTPVNRLWNQNSADGFAQYPYNRQLPHTSPNHEAQSNLPKYTRQLPSSIESAASTFSSLFGRNNAKPKPVVQGKSLFSLLAESKPQVSQTEVYSEHSNYNDHYGMDNSDELMVIESNYGIGERTDNDSDSLMNVRAGAALPTLPTYERPASRHDHYM